MIPPGDITEIPMLPTTKLTHLAAAILASFALAMPLTAMAGNPTTPGGAPDWSTPNTGGPLSNPRPTPPEAKPLLKANLKPNICVTRPEAFKGCAVYN